MSARGLAPGLVLLCVLGWAASCRFEPDLSRFEACADDGSCPTGHTCLAEAQRCLPDCGAQGPCPIDEPTPDAATDAGPDADGGTDAGMDAGEPLSLVTLELPPGIELTPYEAELRADGGLPPYAFRATESLPAGLRLDGGTLSGIPPAPGTFRVAVEVRDQASPPARVSADYELRVRPLLRVAGPKVLVNGYLGTAYQEEISATGGMPPYRFTLEPSGGLPEGLTLQPDGGVRGTPSDSGTELFRVRVTDSDPVPQSAVRELSLTVASAPLLMELATRSVPDARVGTPYHYVLRVSDSSNPTWTLTAGTTPEGIGFDAETGTLLGTPTKPGVWSFTLSASSGLNSDEDTFTLTVY